MITANEIRNSFKQFFASKGHIITQSAPMVIKDDPTLMFTNAGMNQWKDIILGTKNPEPRRRANSQKCLRVSGKHNDLEEVGHDTYHHTMFEMLGNWSFGDYFKQEAIDMAWEYLVNVLNLSPKDLYVTIFEGSKEEGLDRDVEAETFWKKYVPADHIIDGNRHDNFWEMGDTGPCGPCSEIHLDSRTDKEKAKIAGSFLVNKDNPQVIEIWNLVFMQYNRLSDGSLEKLSMNVIDTGMGFERLVRAIQGKQSNYDTDVFLPLINEISRLSGCRYGENNNTDIALRVVADHLRAVAFSIADGQLPSNVKAGYVIRRILRRAIRYAYTFLGQKEPFIFKILPVLIREMKEAYPELVAQQNLISHVIKEEEESFLRTLANGISMLNNSLEEMTIRGEKKLDGTQAFRLFDTYGFPLDLTELICREHNCTVDKAVFDEEMRKQKERARHAAQSESSDWVVLRAGEQVFVGYDTVEQECNILRFRKITQQKKSFFEIILDRTPFYGEMGGQVGDTGILFNNDEKIAVIDTRRENNQSVHIVLNMPCDPKTSFIARVDSTRREACAANHTATHLLDYTLKEVLGAHVEQRGSFVSPDTLRFDFSHFKKMSDEEVRLVERKVNAMIRSDYPLNEFRDIPIERAKELGAIALFGEKYGDRVRVVRFGPSSEFCGGVHSASTGRIGMFKIVSESSIAAGIRRIEAKTGRCCEELVYGLEDGIKSLRMLFNNANDLTGVVKKYIEEHEFMKREIEDFKRQAVERTAKNLISKSRFVAGLCVISAVMPLEAQATKDIVFRIREQISENLFCVIGSVFMNKPMITVMLSNDVVSSRGLNAGSMVRDAAMLIRGGGGGQPHFATAGGKDPDTIHAAVDRVLELAGLAK